MAMAKEGSLCQVDEGYRGDEGNHSFTSLDPCSPVEFQNSKLKTQNPKTFYALKLTKIGVALPHSPINKLSRTYPHAFSQLYEVES